MRILSLVLSASLSLALFALPACTAKDDVTEDMAGGADLAAGPDMFFSCCGKPGDKGNSLQVGSYCEKFTDCFENTKARVCTVLGDPRTHFCTFACTKGGDPAECGEGASCECQGSNCACVPAACLMNTQPECKKTE